jgi:hypothetical protein
MANPVGPMTHTPRDEPFRRLPPVIPEPCVHSATSISARMMSVPERAASRAVALVAGRLAVVGRARGDEEGKYRGSTPPCSRVPRGRTGHDLSDFWIGRRAAVTARVLARRRSRRGAGAELVACDSLADDRLAGHPRCRYASWQPPRDRQTINADLPAGTRGACFRTAVAPSVVDLTLGLRRRRRVPLADAV